MSKIKTAPTQTRDKPRTISALKKAVRKILITHGYSGTTVQTIIAEAGLSRGALFHHFPTKNHLVAAAFADIMRFAGTRMTVLGQELRIGILDRESYADGVRNAFSSELFQSSMEIALNTRLDTQLTDLVMDSVEEWWAALYGSMEDTFHLPGRTEKEARQHWVMAANLLRGHSFTTLFRSDDAIIAGFNKAYAEMIIDPAEIKPLTDSFDRLAEDLQTTVGHRLFTALAVLPNEVERIYTTRPDAYPLTGRKRLDASPWGEHVVHRGQPWLGHDMADLRHMFPDHQTIANLGLGACINIPVHHDGHVIGTLNLLHEGQTYSEESLALATLYARRAAPLFLKHKPST